MSTDLMKRAEKLDNLGSKHVAEKLTLEEAQSIISVWGTYLEHSGGIRILFGIDIPESLLPYPLIILQGAINKMEAYYFEQGMHDTVKALEETEMVLMQYESDKEAIENTITRLSRKDSQEAFISGLKNYQKNQMQAGFLANKKLFKLSKSRIEELEK